MTSYITMGVGIYYFYHGFGLKAFEGRHIRIPSFFILEPFFKLSGSKPLKKQNKTKQKQKTLT